jgi:uncharacterized protein (TIGR00251 family)
MDALSPHPDGCLLEVRVMPRSQPAGVGGLRDGRLLVRVGAAPVDGEANREVLKLLAKRCGVAPSALSVLRGETARNKTILVAGRTSDDLAAALERG